MWSKKGRAVGKLCILYNFYRKKQALNGTAYYIFAQHTQLHCYNIMPGVYSGAYTQCPNTVAIFVGANQNF